ncbi:MAG: hypothetical protein ABI548_11605 [Polyangiaceae bacterium]
MTSNQQQTIELVARLRAVSEWSVGEVESEFGIRLLRDGKSTAKLKVYDAPAREGLFTRTTLNQPIFGGHLGWRILIRVNEAGDVRRSHLESIIPAGSKGGMPPLPTPGSKGPAPFRFWQRVPHPLGECSFSFVGREDNIERLDGITLHRPHPGNDPAYFDASCFRAYATEEASANGYAIERISSRTEAVVVPKLALSGRTLSLEYVAAESMVGEPLARDLLRKLLIEGRLARKLAGQYDTIAFTSVELGSTVTERADR